MLNKNPEPKPQTVNSSHPETVAYLPWNTQPKTKYR